MKYRFELETEASSALTQSALSRLADTIEANLRGDANLSQELRIDSARAFAPDTRDLAELLYLVNFTLQMERDASLEVIEMGNERDTVEALVRVFVGNGRTLLKKISPFGVFKDRKLVAIKHVSSGDPAWICSAIPAAIAAQLAVG